MVEMTICWLEPAQEDLRLLRTYYIENAGHVRARKRISKIMENVSLLISNPLLGKENRSWGGLLNSTVFWYVVIIKYTII